MRAADAIAAGQRDVLIAGGVESMSRVPMDGDTHNIHPRLSEEYNIFQLQMGMTAEKVASETRSPGRSKTSTRSGATSAPPTRRSPVASTTKSSRSRPRTDSSTQTGDPPRHHARRAVPATDGVQVGRDGHARQRLAGL